MEGNYPVYFGLEQVGKVQLSKKGLYYRFVCRCRLSGAVVCRLHVRFGESGQWENLGVVVPVDTGFGLDTSLPAKRFGAEKPEFQLVPKHMQSTTETFIPIAPEEPFSYIARLKEAFLARRGEQLGIVLRNTGSR